MKPVDVKPTMYIGFNRENNKQGPKFKVGDHREYRNIKILCKSIKNTLQKAMFRIALKKFL